MSSNTAAQIESYPALAEMGIVRFHEISDYSIRQNGVDGDVLRVNYKRAKGSLLPFSRKYKFGRAAKTVVVDGGTSRMEQIFEISPVLLRAIAELDMLVETNQHGKNSINHEDLKAQMFSGIDDLETMISSDQSAQNGELSSKLAALRSQLEAL